MGFATLERPRQAGAALVRFAVACLSALLVVVVAGFVVVEVRPDWLAGLRNAVPAPAPHFALRGGASGAHAPTSIPGAASGRDTPSKDAGSPPDGGPLGVAPGGVFAATGAEAPVVSSVQPSFGGPGATLALTGRHLFSSDGHIVVTVAGHRAGVRCPSQARCLVTVPDLGSAPLATSLSLRTDAGWSNTVAFAYR